MLNFVVLDIETTGLSPANNEIIEVGAYKIQDGLMIDSFSSLINPVGYVPRNIMELTGIDYKELSLAEGADTVLPEFYDFVGNMPILGHNLPFDYRFLTEKMKNLGLDFTLNGERKGICTYQLSKKIFTEKGVSHKLMDVAERLKVPVENAHLHRASTDAMICKIIYDRMLVFYSGVAGVKEPSLIEKDTKKYGKITETDTLAFE